MVCVTLCIPCQYGNHEAHVPRQPAPKGVIGGFECPCTGDCKDTHPPVVDVGIPDKEPR